MKICKVESCKMKQDRKGLCSKHYTQQWKYGKILKRTTKDPNEFIIEGEICRIKLYNINCEEIAETIVDVEDYNKVKNHKWSLRPDNYVITMINGKTIRLHRFLLNAKKGEKIDHKSRDPLDNRKSNLRKSTNSQNTMNRGKQKQRNKSIFKGVGWHKEKEIWRARIKINKKTIHLGYFNNEIDAAKEYDKAAVERHGRFACTNKELGLL